MSCRSRPVRPFWSPAVHVLTAIGWRLGSSEICSRQAHVASCSEEACSNHPNPSCWWKRCETWCTTTFRLKTPSRGSRQRPQGRQRRNSLVRGRNPDWS